MREVKVTAIIIFLNEEKFIQEAIESVFTQTYTDWELLLVDDGSKDGSTKIALDYAERYPEKVRYLEHEGHQNRGMSASRNLGVRHAQGEYVAFLDADDVWLPHKLEQQVAILDSRPEAAMVYGPVQWWYSWTGSPEDRQRDFVTNLYYQPNTLMQPPTLLAKFLGNESPTTTVSLIRRDAIQMVGGFEESFDGMFEDQAFYAKLCLNTEIFVSSECWYRWRKHPGSSCIVSVKTDQYHAARFRFLNWLEDYLSKLGAKQTQTWQAVQKQLFFYRHPVLSRSLYSVEYHVNRMKTRMKRLLRQTLPAPAHQWLRSQLRGEKYCPPVGWVHFGSLRRIMPISRQFGFDRGLPIDRYYIEGFLSANASDIHERVLEIGDDTYTYQFGGNRVTKSDVLHVVEGNPKATIVGDLACADHIPSDAFDCIVLPQTLQFIYDARAALKTLYRILKPGGVILATFPGISQSSDDEWGSYWCWSFTSLSARRMFEEVFPTSNVQVEAHGNVLAATSFLQGLAAEELRQEELNYRDPAYETLITVRAVKPEEAG